MKYATCKAYNLETKKADRVWPAFFVYLIVPILRIGSRGSGCRPHGGIEFRGS